MFARYSEEICQDTVAAGNLQFLKNWNKIGKRRVQNTSKNTANMLHIADAGVPVLQATSTNQALQTSSTSFTYN